MDANGRLGDRGIIRRLGWSPDIRLHIREDNGLITVSADPRGLFHTSARGFLLLPAAARRWCRLRAGDGVLIVGDPAAGWLVAHPPAAIAAMILKAHQAAWGERTA